MGVYKVKWSFLVSQMGLYKVTEFPKSYSDFIFYVFSGIYFRFYKQVYTNRVQLK